VSVPRRPGPGYAEVAARVPRAGTVTGLRPQQQMLLVHVHGIQFGYHPVHVGRALRAVEQPVHPSRVPYEQSLRWSDENQPGHITKEGKQQ